MNNPVLLETLGQNAKSARQTLLARIETADTASKALKAAVARLTVNLPEYAAYEMAKTRVAIARNDHDAAVSAYRAEQGISS